MSKQKTQVVFAGIDMWNRAVFRVPGRNLFYGSLDMLFAYGEEEDEVIKQLEGKQLYFFGTEFNCEPDGMPAGNIEIVRRDELAGMNWPVYDSEQR